MSIDGIKKLLERHEELAGRELGLRDALRVLRAGEDRQDGAERPRRAILELTGPRCAFQLDFALALPLFEREAEMVTTELNLINAQLESMSSHLAK